METEENKLETKPDQCDHNYVIDRTLLHKKTIWGSSDVLSAIVYCSKCGHISSSSRIEA